MEEYKIFNNGNKVLTEIYELVEKVIYCTRYREDGIIKGNIIITEHDLNTIHLDIENIYYKIEMCNIVDLDTHYKITWSLWNSKKEILYGISVVNKYKLR